jgi:hypothetical protein
MKYSLTCECGQSQPVEPRQAGQSLICACGKTLQVPTMLQIKRLPEWEDEGAGKPESAAQEDVDQGAAPEGTAHESMKKAPKQPRISPKRKGLFIAAGFVFVVAVFFIGRIAHKPDPISVHFKRTVYRADGKDISRHSTPTTPEDFYFYFIPDPTNETGIAYADDGYPLVVNDDIIDRGLSLFGAYTYFEYVKTPNFSDNFNENYEAILTRWKTALAIWGFIAFVALVVALLALFTKESTKQVGVARGEGWG